MREYAEISSGIAGLRSKAGFTMIELMVASGITIFLVGLLVGMISAVTSGWQRVQGTLSTEAQARLILDQMAADLEGAVYKPDGSAWLAFSVVTAAPANTYLDDHGWQYTIRSALPSHTVLIKPASSDPDSLALDALDISDARYGQAGGWLRFFTTYQDSNQSDRDLSAPTAVGYQIVRRNVSGETNNNPTSNPAEIRYQFYRSVVRKTKSPSGLPGTFDVGFDLFLTPGTGYYAADDSYEGDAGNVTRPHANSLLANNVVDFGIRLYVVDTGNLRLVFPANGSGGLASHLVDPDHFSASSIAGDPGRFPDVVEVMVRILTDDGARQIQNLEAGRTTGDWWAIAEANSRVFTRRIQTLARHRSP
jgi:hypothetical protein